MISDFLFGRSHRGFNGLQEDEVTLVEVAMEDLSHNAFGESPRTRIYYPSEYNGNTSATTKTTDTTTTIDSTDCGDVVPQTIIEKF